MAACCFAAIIPKIKSKPKSTASPPLTWWWSTRTPSPPPHGAFGKPPVPPERVHLPLRGAQELRAGENPPQAAALCAPAGRAPEGLAAAKQLQGKELSYNNFVDLEAARSLAAEFRNPA